MHRETVSIAVPVDDLNLSVRAGRDVLQRRVEAALNRACGRRPDPRDLRMRQERARCMQEARTEAEVQVANLLASRQLAETATAPGS